MTLRTFDLAKEDGPENLVKTRSGGQGDRRLSGMLVTCFDLATTWTGSRRGLE
jgi:hypothetical protein